MTAADDTTPAHGFDVFARDPQLIRPLGHPLRMRVYVDAVRAPVSAKELAARYEQPLARVSYHVKALADAGLLRAVRRTPRRGAVETHYRAIATLDVDDEALRALPREARLVWFENAVRLVGDDMLHALSEGAFDEPDIFISRAHFRATASGRRRLQAEVVAMYERLGELRRELAAEADASGEEAYELNVVLSEYLGDRRAGRNGPHMIMWDREGEPVLDTIPDGYE